MFLRFFVANGRKYYFGFVFLCGVFVLYGIGHVLKYRLPHNIHDYLWDFGVYERAVSDYGKGLNPYRTDIGLLFVYHPVVLKFFCFVDSFFGLDLFFFGFLLFVFFVFYL